MMKYTKKVASGKCKMEKFNGIDDKFSELKTHKERNNLLNYSNTWFGLMQIRENLKDTTEMVSKYFNTGSDDDKSGLKVVNDILSKQFNEVLDIFTNCNMVFDLKIFLQKYIEKQEKEIEFEQKFSENLGGRRTKQTKKQQLIVMLYIIILCSKAIKLMPGEQILIVVFLFNSPIYVQLWMKCCI